MHKLLSFSSSSFNQLSRSKIHNRDRKKLESLVARIYILSAKTEVIDYSNHFNSQSAIPRV